jgi:hypothetical protein
VESRFFVIWWVAPIMIGSSLIALATPLNQRVSRLVHVRFLGRLRHNRTARKLRKFHEAYLAYRKHAGALVTFFLLTIAEQLVAVAMLWLTALALGIHLGLLPFLVAVPLSFLIARLSIGGI